ncbi:MAG: hypothetical protein LIO96_03530 [Lachnospiraceae bacterium]|nr:hypothetical protein [Lachnospiraceae bacterium]
MRIQNEIVGERFNRFSDMVDLDRLAAQEYTPEVIVAISESIARHRQNTAMAPLDTEGAKELAAQARTGSYGIAQLIMDAMEVTQNG